MRTKFLSKKEISENIIDEKSFIINQSKGDLYFEIGEETTHDVAEAVSILMRRIDFSDPIWNKKVKNSDILDINPEKSLFWLSGGYDEWDKLTNYRLPWSDCVEEFKEEFGFLVVNSVRKSNTLKDIRDYFIKYINLPTLYDFAVSKNFVK